MTLNQQTRREIQPQQVQAADAYILYDTAFLAQPDAEFFDPDHWRSQDALLGTAQGRGAAVIFCHDGNHYVLRHYRRGGLMAKLSDDKYRWSGLEKSRAWREWYLLAKMYQQGLPVPRPIAARVQRHGLFYRADLVTLCLPNVQPLADVLMVRKLDAQTWRKLGATLRHFHDAGIYHADLNARNILLDAQGQVFVIDFDKGEERRPDNVWQQANIDRLERSFNKFKNSEACFYFDGQAMAWLLAGYGA